jgi:hypothetical protein
MDQESQVTARTPHKHLFTPGEWCMRPYCAQYGLTREKVKSVAKLEHLIMDQYARDCGFEPTDSWVLIVHPSGDCEFTPLGNQDPLWCCEEATEIEAGIGPAIAEAPPYERNSVAARGSLDEALKILDEGDLDALTGASVIPAAKYGPGFRDYNPFRNSPFNNSFNNAFPNAFPNIFRNR